jgi:hypothetical protein
MAGLPSLAVKLREAAALGRFDFWPLCVAIKKFRPTRQNRR